MYVQYVYMYYVYMKMHGYQGHPLPGWIVSPY